MLIFGYICLAVAVIIAIIWLYRMISGSKKYVKTVGEIVDLKSMAPLVEKRQIDIGGNYAYTECKYQGYVYVTVRFIDREGEELVRRYNSSEPLLLKINEHEHSAPQYTSLFPDWHLGERIKIFYDPQNTLEIRFGVGPQ